MNQKIFKSIKLLLLSSLMTILSHGMEQTYTAFEVDPSDAKKSHIGTFEELLLENRKCLYHFMDQMDLLAFTQTSRKAFTEACHFLKSPSDVDLEMIPADTLGKLLARRYAIFSGTLKLRNAKARDLPMILPYCLTVKDLDLSQSNLLNSVHAEEYKTSLRYISELQCISNLEKLSVSNLKTSGLNWILAILNSKCLRNLREINYTNSMVIDIENKNSFSCTLAFLEVFNLEGSYVNGDTYQCISNHPGFKNLIELNLSSTYLLNKKKPFYPDLSNLLIVEGSSYVVLPYLKKLILSASALIPPELKIIRPDLEIVTKN